MEVTAFVQDFLPGPPFLNPRFENILQCVLVDRWLIEIANKGECMLCFSGVSLSHQNFVPVSIDDSILLEGFLMFILTVVPFHCEFEDSLNPTRS